jgi:OmpA-OmpF porin, OOP family
MKKLFLLICLWTLTAVADAQIKGVLDRMKQRVKDKSNQKINTTADNTVDSAFTKTERTVKETVKDATTKDTTEKKQNSGNMSPDNNSNNVPADNHSNNTVSFKTYSKYDFVPGEKVIGFEDFSTGNIGDFPAGWNTNASGEIVTIEGKPGRWLWLTKPGAFVPEFTNMYPEDFTFEFDLLHGFSPGGTPNFLFVSLAELDNIKQPEHWQLCKNHYTLVLWHGQDGQEVGSSESQIRQNAESVSANSVETKQLGFQNTPVHVSIWRQKERVRAYINEEKIWDIPKALLKDARLNSLVFFMSAVDANYPYYISNLRLAVGAPDTRNKMLTQNKWVTHGILFDVNSDNIKSESYGTLKEMASVLKEYPELKVRIIGHTDADGNDENNLDLSKRRAASVKSALMNDFGIDGARMETDGKGESETIDKNDTPAGKANNRRVEFIKI